MTSKERDFTEIEKKIASFGFNKDDIYKRMSNLEEIIQKSIKSLRIEIELDLKMSKDETAKAIQNIEAYKIEAQRMG